MKTTLGIEEKWMNQTEEKSLLVWDRSISKGIELYFIINSAIVIVS